MCVKNSQHLTLTISENIGPTVLNIGGWCKVLNGNVWHVRRATLTYVGREGEMNGRRRRGRVWPSESENPADRPVCVPRHHRGREKKRDCSGKRRNSSPPPSAPAGQHTSRNTLASANEFTEKEGGGRGIDYALFAREVFYVFCFFFVFRPFFVPLPQSFFFLSGQRRRPLVRGLTIGSSKDAARLPRRRRDPLSSDPRSGRPG